MVVSGDFTSIIGIIFGSPTTRRESRRQFPEARFVNGFRMVDITLPELLRGLLPPAVGSVI